MKKHISLSLCALASLLLAGCAGTSTSFQCDATTSDRCMTMQQANDLARKKTQGARETGKPDAGSLPALVDLPTPSVTPLSAMPLAPLPATKPPVGASAPRAAERTTPLTQSNNATQPLSTTSSPPRPRAVFTPAAQGSAPLHTEATCTAPRCDTLGEATPLRLADTLATVWIAPWIDAADVFHQPGRVSFVATPGTWQLPQQLN